MVYSLQLYLLTILIHFYMALKQSISCLYFIHVCQVSTFIHVAVSWPQFSYKWGADWTNYMLCL